MSTVKKVLIGGGTGFIGRKLAQLLRDNGYTVINVSRMPGPDNISWGDLEHNGLPHQTTAVVNLAGQNVLDPTRRWSPGFQQNVWNSRVSTTRVLNKAIRDASNKPQAFVTISGVGIYPTNTDIVFTEDSHVEAVDYLSELAIAWENAAKLPVNVPVRQTAVRSGVVIGRGGGIIKSIYMPFFFGVGGPIGTGTQYMPWIHVEDLCRLLKFAIESHKVSGVLNGVAPQIITNKQFTEEFAKVLRRPAMIPMPSFALNALFGEVRAKMMLEGQKVLPKRTQELGFTYDYPDIRSALLTCNRFFSDSFLP